MRARQVILSITSPVALTHEQRKQLRDVAARLHQCRRAALLGTVMGELVLERQSDGTVSNRQLAAAINFGMREVLRGWMS